MISYWRLRLSRIVVVPMLRPPPTDCFKRRRRRRGRRVPLSGWSSSPARVCLFFRYYYAYPPTMRACAPCRRRKIERNGRRSRGVSIVYNSSSEKTTRSFLTRKINIPTEIRPAGGGGNEILPANWGSSLWRSNDFVTRGMAGSII